MVDLPRAPSVGGVYTVCILMPILATVAVLLRFWVRRVRTTRFGIGIDDWTVLLATIILWSMSGVIMNGISLRLFGYHTKIDPTTGEEILTWRERRQVKYTEIFLMMNVVCLGVIKLSVLLLYRRIFAVSRRFNITSIIMGVIVVLWASGFLLSYIFECGTHIWASWTNRKTIERYCGGTKTEAIQTVSFCVTDVLTDLMILVTPIPMIMKLQMSFPAKIGICAVFALGLLSTAAGLVRAVITGLLEFGTTFGGRDLIGANTNVVVWSLVEVSVAITAASLPTIRPLFMGKSVESLLGSLRSVFSLRSRTSTKNADYGEHSLQNDEGAFPLSPAQRWKDHASVSTRDTRNELETQGKWMSDEP